MRKHKILALLFMGAALIGCSHSVPYANHKGDRGIDPIDDLVVELKTEYLNSCYEPIKVGKIPLTECQTTLFGVMERRHGLRFSDAQLNRSAEEIFFKQYIDERLTTLVRGDSQVRREVKMKFRNKDELVSYYRKLYSFKNL